MPDFQMPLLGYGTFPLKDPDAEGCTLMALELGYRHLDTAQMYRNEREAVDLLLLHWLHPSLDMAGVLEQLVVTFEAGQARSIGFPISALTTLPCARACPGRITCHQIKRHPFVNQRPAIEAAAGLGVKLVVYCPVARGMVLDDPTLQAIIAAGNVKDASCGQRDAIASR